VVVVFKQCTALAPLAALEHKQAGHTHGAPLVGQRRLSWHVVRSCAHVVPLTPPNMQ
jgi:hypothetical protein